MKAEELVARLQTTDPKLLGGIPERKAVALVRGILKTMSGVLGETEEGVVKFTGLGQFRVKKVVKSVEGEESAGLRIMFRRIEAKKGKGEAEADAGEAE